MTKFNPLSQWRYHRVISTSFSNYLSMDIAHKYQSNGDTTLQYNFNALQFALRLITDMRFDGIENIR